MMLHSIPPANRQPRHPPSSMRAAANAGLTMVGRQSRQPTPSEETFRPKTVRPNPQVQEQKEGYYKAVELLAKQLTGLAAAATDPSEILHWQRALDQLKENTIW
jgi:hypothetical protein